MLALVAVIGAVLLFGNGFAGPAPIALVAAGGLIVIGVTFWRPPPPAGRRGPYPR
ncbi:MAG TPA: hypothetical protein VHV79_10655 [Mycobacteriales bacterium]|nr:hypothetical protein [Mycobacteriales bacterium]